MKLLPGERIDELEYKNLRIIQNKDGFCFGIDSILLTDYAKNIKKDSKVVDLGTGTGIIPILLSEKTELSKIVGIEIQKEVYDMAKRSVELNKLQDKIELINSNIKNIENKLEMGTFDAVISNPPYKKNNTGIQNQNEKKLISRHEITASLEDFIQTASKLLKDQKDFYMVHRPDRLVDIMELLRKYKLEPKTIRLVYPKQDQAPNLLLIKATKNAKSFLKVEKPLYVYKEDNKYTDEILKIYGKGN